MTDLARTDQELQVRARPKVPMAEAAMMLAILCDRIDEGVDPTEALTAAFQETRLDLVEAIDRRIAFDAWIKGAITSAKSARDEWAAKAKQLEMVHDRFKENTKAIVEAHPDLPYQGKLGKIAIQKNPPALQLTFADKYISPDMVSTFGIDEAYIRTEVIRSIDTAFVKSEILAGREIPWASLESGTHIRFKK